ncbi:MarR family winged helix-turn-helix transcriptional regulator [Pseudonocardia acaciae]|uniref:MarR family winged helix-turn-helix transcriptional regulator n=1 Tax=Pseudonocardia acaciae TaxID=551276 RepID=UPI00048ED00A|nr:MarR family transcriptional regulator [Pseudonocardia acaciae]
MDDAAQALEDLTTEVFALNTRLERAGDGMTAPVGLSAARWRVLGRLEDGPATATQLAAEYGIRRQAAQQLVARLREDGLVETVPNPKDRRAPLVRMTERGVKTLSLMEPVGRAWTERMSESIPIEDLAAAVRVLRVLRRRFDEELGNP